MISSKSAVSLREMYCNYLAIGLKSITYLKTRSALFPFVEAFLHINQRLSSGILNELGSLSPNEAPGMSLSQRHGELVTRFIPSTITSTDLRVLPLFNYFK